MGLWTLPDQIDGQVYNFDFANESCFCCELYARHELGSYVSDASEVWEPGSGNNPFVDGETVRVGEELRIAAGTTVTIRDMRFEFSENARVVVEPGAYLRLDNSVFTTNDCDCGMWLGVEVHGNPSLGQSTANQGYLEIKNNSIIEHAFIGVLAGSRADGFDSDSHSFPMSGGVIRATDSRFRNNKRGVQIQDYIWQGTSGQIATNFSSFTNCDFLTDGLLNNDGVFPEYHALIHNVSRIRFTNCSFRNTASFGDLPIANRGTGIYSDHATFRVTGKNQLTIFFTTFCLFQPMRIKHFTG